MLEKSTLFSSQSLTEIPLNALNIFFKEKISLTVAGSLINEDLIFKVRITENIFFLYSATDQLHLPL